MSSEIRHLLAYFLQLGPPGLVLMGILDSSFLFLPVGNDLLLVVLTARHPENLPIYVICASLGSTIGVLLLDLVCRKGGEGGLKKLMSEKRLRGLKEKMKHSAAIIVVIACIAPPPFPFTAFIAAASAFQYPRTRLLALVFGARAVRFTLISLLASKYGRHILRIGNSQEFVWFMAGFTVLCIVGSTVSIIRWTRRGGQPDRRGESLA